MKEAAVILIFHDINSILTCPPEQFFVPTLLAEFSRRSPPPPLSLRVSSPLLAIKSDDSSKRCIRLTASFDRGDVVNFFRFVHHRRSTRETASKFGQQRSAEEKQRGRTIACMFATTAPLRRHAWSWASAALDPAWPVAHRCARMVRGAALAASVVVVDAAASDS